MKNLSLKLFSVAAIAAIRLSASAQNVDMRDVSNFHGVSAAGGFNVHIKIDGKENLHMTGKAEILKEIETEVENGVLQIHFRKDFYRENFNEKVDIDISAKALSSLTGTGATKIDVEGALTGDHVRVVTTGAGKVTTEVKAESFEGTVTGAGDLNVKGSTTNAKYVITGSGKMNAYELKTEDVKVTITGAGSARIFADKTISASTAGAGNILFRGNAKIEHFSSAGAGHISKENGE